MPLETQPLQVAPNPRFQPCRLGKLFPQRLRQACHLLGERLPVILDISRPDIASRGQNEAVLFDGRQLRRIAETSDILVLASPFLAPPGVVGASDFLDVGIGQFTVGAVILARAGGTSEILKAHGGYRLAFLASNGHLHSEFKTRLLQVM